MDLTQRDYWAGFWAEEAAHRGFLYFDDVAPFLVPSPDTDFLEIGCAPGGILADFCLRLGYRAHGIDYACDAMALRRSLEARGVIVGEIHAADFRAWRPERRYDVVASFGFVEHFEDAADMIDRHFQLVRPGGTVIVGVPNFARGQKVLHFLFDREHLRMHNTRCMSLAFLRACARRNGAEIRALRYTGGHFAFWPGPAPRSRFQEAWMQRCVAAVHRLARRFPGTANPFLSPYLLGVFRA